MGRLRQTTKTYERITDNLAKIWTRYLLNIYTYSITTTAQLAWWHKDLTLHRHTKYCSFPYLWHVTKQRLSLCRSDSGRHGTWLYEYHEGWEWSQCFGIHERWYSKSCEGNIATGKIDINPVWGFNIQFAMPIQSITEIKSKLCEEILCKSLPRYTHC
jgi:hypothetical protein